jgi:hypothetical protein
MNHPKPEQWVSYVCGEAARDLRNELTAHLQQCPQCRAEIENWKHTLNRLNAWKLPSRHRVYFQFVPPILKWATAVALVLMTGVLVGRATAPKINPDSLRRAIATDVRRDLDQELARLVREEVVRNASLTLASDHRYTDQVAEQLYVLLKKELDTVAVNADVGLRHTAMQLVQLADYKEPQNITNSHQ